MKIRSLGKTCFVIPSVWEGVFEDGREFMVRYRHGKLTLRTFDGLLLCEINDGSDLGIMDTPTMLDKLGLTADETIVAAVVACEHMFDKAFGEN